MIFDEVLYYYNARVVRVVDGDTLDLDIDLGFHITIRHRVRLVGINTPETFGPKAKTEGAAGLAAKQFVESQLPVGCAVQVRTHLDAADKYGRLLADVWYTIPNTTEASHIGKELLSRGLAVKYMGEK